MQRSLFNLAAVAIGLHLILSVGCAATADHVGGLFSKMTHKTPLDPLAQVKTPADRIKELKGLAKGAEKRPPEEQQRIVAELTHELQHESDPLLRRQILRTVSAYPTPAAQALLAAALNDNDTETRRVACVCLGKRRGPEAVHELTRVISSDTNPDVRLAAARALGESGEQAALAPLSEAMIDPDPAMQALARESLANISGRDYGNNVDAWREYAKTGTSSAAEVSIAERFIRTFY